MRFSYVALAAMPALFLVGCGQADTGPKSMEEAKKEAAELDRPRPGQYKQTVQVTQFDVPGAPPEATAQFKAMMQQAQETSFCLTEKMAEKGFRDMFDKVAQGGECKYDRFDVDGGRIDAVMNCNSAGQGKALIKFAGKVTPEGSDVTVQIDQDNPAVPGGKAKIGMHLASQRTGDCTAADAAAADTRK